MVSGERSATEACSEPSLSRAFTPSRWPVWKPGVVQRRSASMAWRVGTTPPAGACHRTGPRSTRSLPSVSRRQPAGRFHTPREEPSRDSQRRGASPFHSPPRLGREQPPGSGLLVEAPRHLLQEEVLLRARDGLVGQHHAVRAQLLRDGALGAPGAFAEERIATHRAAWHALAPIGQEAEGEAQGGRHQDPTQAPPEGMAGGREVLQAGRDLHGRASARTESTSQERPQRALPWGAAATQRRSPTRGWLGRS